MILVAYHLYLRTGTSPTEDFIIKMWFSPNVKLYGFHAQQKSKDEGLVWYGELLTEVVKAKVSAIGLSSPFAIVKQSSS